MKTISLTLAAAVVLTVLTQCRKSGTSENPDPTEVEIRDSVIASGLNHAWEIVWGPDSHIWFTERGGKISRLNPKTGDITTIYTIAEVVANGEGGLLGMALHPEFSLTPHVFVAYNYNESGYKEKIVRFTYSHNTLTNPVTILERIVASSIHNGCRLLISPDRKLFITTGDANNTSLPQDISSLNGKVLRINLDGSIPADNPDPASAVWSKGHRNPQGLVWANGRLYSSEHGPSSDDEINIIEKSGNYGWPDVRGYCNEPSEAGFCNTNDVKEPIQAWTPTIATCGLDYYNANEIPQWKNSLLLATLKNSRLYQLKLNDSFDAIAGINEFFTGDYGRMRDICISPEGKVYISTSNGGNNDVIVEITAR